MAVSGSWWRLYDDIRKNSIVYSTFTSGLFPCRVPLEGRGVGAVRHTYNHIASKYGARDGLVDIENYVDVSTDNW